MLDTVEIMSPDAHESVSICFDTHTIDISIRGPYTYERDKISKSPSLPTIFTSSAASHIHQQMFKYKKVAVKVKPVKATLPEQFRIVRYRHPHPLKDLPTLPVQSITVSPGTRFTEERIKAFPLSDEL